MQVEIKIITHVFAMSCLLATAGCSGPKKNISKTVFDKANTQDGYELVWADEFNTHGSPDSANWRFEKGFVRNNELQWYQPENAECQNGYLVIEGRKEAKPNPVYESGSSNWKRNRQQIEYT